MPLLRKSYARRRPTMRRRRPTTKTLAPRARKAVATIANRVVNRRLETKYAPREIDSYTAIYGDTIPTGGDVQLFTCLPQIEEGSASYQRDGRKISPVKHRTELIFGFNDDAILIPPGSGTTVPAAQAGWDLTVHIWYGYVKRFKNASDVADATLSAEIVNNMFQNVSGTTQRWMGLPVDQNLELNKEFVGLKHKKFRMYKNAGLANVGDATSPSLSTPMSEAKRVLLSFKPPKTLLYKDEDQLFPENYAPFCVIGYCHNDTTGASRYANAGPTSNILYIPALKMWQTDKIWYKDA